MRRKHAHDWAMLTILVFIAVVVTIMPQLVREALSAAAAPALGRWYCVNAWNLAPAPLGTPIAMNATMIAPICTRNDICLTNVREADGKGLRVKCETIPAGMPIGKQSPPFKAPYSQGGTNVFSRLVWPARGIPTPPDPKYDEYVRGYDTAENCLSVCPAQPAPTPCLSTIQKNSVNTAGSRLNVALYTAYFTYYRPLMLRQNNTLSNQQNATLARYVRTAIGSYITSLRRISPQDTPEKIHECMGYNAQVKAYRESMINVYNVRFPSNKEFVQAFIMLYEAGPDMRR